MFVEFNTIYVFLGIMVMLEIVILILANNPYKPKNLSPKSIAEIRRQRALLAR